MIGRQTVLVLGAGASQPYGFPLGAGLVDQVCTEILDENQGRTLGTVGADGKQYFVTFSERLKRLGHRPDLIERFAVQMRQARPYSIDAFLETRTEFRTVGKAAIADVLL